MKAFLPTSFLLFIATTALAAEPGPSSPPAASASQSMVMNLVPQDRLVPGTPTSISVTLNRMSDNTPVTLQMLNVVHGNQIRLLMIDPNLSEYYYVLPTLGSAPGEYQFSLTPKKATRFRVWADITPSATNKQEYVMSDIPDLKPAKPEIDRTPVMKATVQGYTIDLHMDPPPTVGEVSNAELRFATTAGTLVGTLQPIMGTYAYVIGFSEALDRVIVMQPTGPQPNNEAATYGPNIGFQFTPSHAGFTKIYAHFKIGGKEMIAPFGVNVKARAKD